MTEIIQPQKGRLKQIKMKQLQYPGCLTITSCFLCFAMYSMIATPSVMGLVGTIFLNLIFVLGAEILIHRISGFCCGGIYGICMIALAFVFAIISAIFPELCETRIVINVVIGFILLFILWMIFLWKKSSSERLWGMLLVFGILLASIYYWHNLGSFSSDSYSYYEISQTFSSEFGLIHTIRQYVIRSDYNISFPYFFPLCIFIVDKITGLGRYSGTFLNLYVMIYTCIVLLQISKQFVNKLWCGVLVSFLLFVNPSYLDEACAARSIPIALAMGLVFVLICADLFSSEEKSVWKPLISGACAGAVMVTRFDEMALAAFGMLVMLLVQKNRRIQNLVFYLAGVFALVLPWIIYSWIHFQSLWISDNLGTMFLVNAAAPHWIILPGDGTETLFNAPMAWFVALIKKTFHIGCSLLKCSLGSDILLLIFWFLLFIVLRDKKVLNKKWVAVLVTVFLYCVGKTCMYILVGYGDTRYHIETVTFAILCIAMLYEKLTANKAIINNTKITIMIVGLLTICGSWQLKDNILCIFTEPYEKPLAQIEIMPENIQIINDELSKRIDDDTEILFIGDSFPISFGCWTERKTYVFPDQTAWEKVEYAMEQYMDVEYVVLPAETEIDKFSDGQKEIFEHLSDSYSAEQLVDWWLFSVK